MFLLPFIAFALMSAEVYAGCDVFTHSRGADIVFLIDSSGSVGSDNFKKQLGFVSNLLNTIAIGPMDNQLGVETFSKHVYHHFSLNATYRKSDLNNIMKHIPYVTGGTNTGEALRYVISNSFTRQRGGRPHVPQILIVTTDGRSDNQDETLAAAQALHAKNMTSICIGIGNNVNKAEISAIASTPGNAVYVHDFNALLSTVLNLTLSKIQQSACRWTQTTKTKTPSPTIAVKTGLTTLLTTTQSNTVAVRANVTTSSSQSINRGTRSLHRTTNARASSTTQHISSANSNDAMFHPFLFEGEWIKKAEIGILVLVSMISAGLSICCCHKLFLLFKRKENDNEDEEKNEIQAISSFDTVAYSSKIFPKKFPSGGPFIDFPSSYRGIKDTQW